MVKTHQHAMIHAFITYIALWSRLNIFPQFKTTQRTTSSACGTSAPIHRLVAAVSEAPSRYQQGLCTRAFKAYMFNASNTQAWQSLHPCRAPGSLEVSDVKWLWVLNCRGLTHQNVDPKGGQQSDGLNEPNVKDPNFKQFHQRGRTSVCIRWRKCVFLTWALSPLCRIQTLWKQLEKVSCWCAAEEHELDSLLACGNMTSSYRHREHDREGLLGSEQLAHAMAKKYSGVPSSECIRRQGNAQPLPCQRSAGTTVLYWEIELEHRS